MITLKTEYEQASKQFKEILDKVKRFILKSYNINENELLSNTEFYVRKLLSKTKILNDEILDIRLQREKVRNDLDDLERAFVGGDCVSPNEVGKNTGLKPDNVMIREIEKIQLKEELGSLLLKCKLMEHSLLEQNELIKSFFECIPQQQYIEVLKMMFIECFTTGKIASELNYSYDYVRQVKKRAITSLSEILKITISHI